MRGPGSLGKQAQKHLFNIGLFVKRVFFEGWPQLKAQTTKLCCSLISVMFQNTLVNDV